MNEIDKADAAIYVYHVNLVPSKNRN